VVTVAAVAALAVGGIFVIGPATSGAADGGSDRPTPVGPSRAPDRVDAGHAGADSGPSNAAPASDVSAQATLSPTTTADGGVGSGSLRDVVENQATNGGGDTVTLAAGATYVLTCANGGDIAHGNTPLTIAGNGALITMEAGCNERLFHNGTGNLEFDNVQLSNVTINLAINYAGALVLTGGNLTLSGVTSANNNITAHSTDLFEVGSGKTTTANNTLVTGTTILDAGTGHCGIFCTYPMNGDGLVVANTTITASHGTCGIFCSNDVSLNNSSVVNTSFTDTGGNGSCGIFCSGDVDITGTNIGNTTFHDQTGGSCGVFCSGDVTMTDSNVANTTFNDVAGNCAIFCSGDVTMLRSAVDNTTETDTNAEDGSGLCGGVFCSGDVTMTDSRVTNTSTDEQDSSQTDSCGGVFCSGDVTMLRSSVTGTRLTGPDICGGVFCSGDVDMTNSTLADNLATSTGGSSSGVFDSGNVSFVYVTMVGNHSAGQPALDDIGEFSTFGSVLADSGAGGNCANGISVSSTGYNWADDSSCGLSQTGDVQNNGGNPVLAPLGDYGGPGPTRPPALGSPLIDKVDCTARGAGGITDDERGVTRPQGSACDVGAVEVRTSSLVVSKTVSGAAVGSTGYTFNVACNDGTNTQVTVADTVHGGTSSPVTGIKFGATCTVVEVPINAAPINVTYDPAGVNTTGMLINQDGVTFVVSVTNAYVVLVPTFTG
jgi:hypothetical protein